MSKTNDLLKNIGFLSFSSLGIKIATFFMVPLYTSILSTEDYGQFDFINTTISLLLPFLTLNISEATVVFSLSKQSDKVQVLSISLKYAVRSFVWFTIILFVNNLLNISSLLSEYCFVIELMFVAQVMNAVMLGFARGLDKIKQVAISSIISSLIIILLSIFTLLILNMGLMGYFIANILGPMGQVVYLFGAVKCWKYISKVNIKSKLESEMISFSTPLIFNSTAWWINSVSDRYIIIWLRGMSESGIYSIASKIPTVLDVFRGIFIQAWMISAVKEFDKNDSDGFFSNMFNVFNLCMMFCCSVLIILARFLSSILYANHFFEAWRYVPFLLIAVFFGSLSGYIGSIYAAAKDSKMYAYSTIAGAIVNLFLNLFLIRFFGGLGAAVSTMISYWIIYIIRLINVKKHMNLKLNVFRDSITYIIMLLQGILLLYYEADTLFLYFCEVGMLIIIIICHIKTIYILKGKFFNVYRGVVK